MVQVPQGSSLNGVVWVWRGGLVDPAGDPS